jgi:integrase
LGYKELPGLVLPAIRRDKKLPRVMSTEDVRTLLHCCELYTKALLSIIYDCGLRAFEACNLKWTDIDIHRKMVHIKRGKGGRDISSLAGHLSPKSGRRSLICRYAPRKDGISVYVRIVNVR